MKIEIVTSFYIPQNEERLNEYVKALTNNLNNKYINTIHLFVDNEKGVDYLKNKYKDVFYSKIKIIKIGKQPLYSDLFAYCNTLKQKICLVLNLDIWLHSIKNINIFDKLKENKQKTVFSLTRHEYDLSCPLIDKPQGSHDAFIFISPINENIIKHVKHKQNVWGSENTVCYEFNKLKYKLYNPCKQIIIVHEHKSKIRESGRQRIKKRSHVVRPIFL